VADATPQYFGLLCSGIPENPVPAVQLCDVEDRGGYTLHVLTVAGVAHITTSTLTNPQQSVEVGVLP
jgi:hypothetical protein